ncbi:MAG: transcriptional regulator [Acidobacteria bacterium]|nr:transcriptional regulator [Acidobacteriota bacterium]
MDFDRHLTSSARLSIVAALVNSDRLSFTELKARTGLADGNLHIQTKKLEEGSYLVKTKRLKNGRPVTFFSLSPEGLTAFELHIRKLQRILDARVTLPRPVSREEYQDASRVW